MKYNHRVIEKKWQREWEERKTFQVEVDESRPKYYVLDMFPYPSGAGLHVGHVVGYTASDIIARFMRQKGYNVLHPMGWDSFGLPAEQYAIRTGTHPAVTTEKNIDNIRKQLKQLGFSYDWSRELATSDEKYYKWTQWIFSKLYEKGLAYEMEAPVNFCPALGTVLANEEVEDGRSKEGGYPVERRPLRQWMLKITAYAERLLDDLDLVDWPESLKKLQRNWIGKSEGAMVHFSTDAGSITVFTTRPDTLFGATFMVLAPEHPLVDPLTTPEQREAIAEYQKNAASKSDLDRSDQSKEKTGVYTGSYATNPVNGEELPIWIADYVMMGYGTGAVMAVPNHDERDFEFAKKFGLKVIPVLDPQPVPDNREDILAGNACWPGEGELINSANAEISLNGLTKEPAKVAISEWLESKGFGELAINYKLRDWLFSRQRYWAEPFPVLHYEDGSQRALELDELPLTLPEMTDFKPTGDGKSPLSKVKNWVEITDPQSGKKAWRETNTMPQWAGSCWYYLRFVDPTNSTAAWDPTKEHYWLPVDLYIGGVEHAVLHLLYARFWHKVLYDCGLVHTQEPFQCLRNQGVIVARSFQKEGGGYVPPEEVTKKEKKYFHRDTGEELRSQIEKMSKSKLNGVSPDAIIDEYGADALRLYEMFMGPLEKEKIWNTDAVSGCYRFLVRFFELATSDKVSDETTEEALKLGHKLVDHIAQDIQVLQFNTAIAKLMEFLNAFSKLNTYPKCVVEWATQLLSPLAPHIAEEIWEHLGHTESIAFAPLPTPDPSYLVEETATYIIQVNGKMRGRFDLPKDQDQESLLSQAKENPHIAKFLDAKPIAKVVFVPNKLLNIVLSD